ncbi:MAG: murein biosynthesis integral membrane protein MurJ [Bdellovibrionota bacterium]
MEESPRKISLLRGTSVVASMTVLSRVFGFVRDLFIARLFGAGVLADAFFVAFRIPNLLRSLAAEGALTSAFVPVFSSELEKGLEPARKTLAATSTLITQIVATITILGIYFAPEIVSLIAPGFTSHPEQFEITVLLSRIMLPYILFISLISMCNGALNSVSVFGASAIAQIVVNIALIIGAITAGFYEKTLAVVILACSVPLGGFFALVSQYPLLKKARLLVIPSLKSINNSTLEILKLMLPAVLGAAIYQLGIFLNTALASVLDVGSVSWLFYADRIIQLPIGIFTVALASVLLPALSRANASDNQQDFLKSMNDSLRYTGFIIIPISFGLYFFSEPIVRIVFQRGEFTELDSLMTAISIKAYCFGLWAVSIHSMLVRSFLAKKDTLTPTIIGAISLCVGFTGSVLIMGEPVRDEGWISQIVTQIHLLFPTLVLNFKHVGLALGSIFYSFTALILSAAILMVRIPDLRFSQFIISSLRSCFAAFIMYVILDFLFDINSLSLITLILAVISGAIFYILASFCLFSPELKETSNKILGLLKAKKQINL